MSGGTFNGVDNFAFIYDSKKGTYDALDSVLSVLDINDAGIQVGSTDFTCAYRDKNGNIITVNPPSFVEGGSCQLRGLNAQGKMAGFQVNPFGTFLGFTYDPKKEVFEEFLPSLQTFAHGINAKGEVAGSVFLDADEAFAGSAAGRYGYLRDKNGNIKTFSITQALDGFTRARGLSESGNITGFYADAVTTESKSFVTKLSKGTEHEEITLADNQIIFQKPCNPDTPPPPSEDYQLFTGMTASQVRNDGTVAGSCSDIYFNPITGDQIQYGYGWLATPTK